MKTQQHVTVIIYPIRVIHLYAKITEHLKKNNKRHSNSCKKKHRVVLIGDSHIKGCAENITNLLDKSYSVLGISKPNANLEAITSSINLETEKLAKKDIIIISGGTVDEGLFYQW
jgi:hypothetical protein